ncbi:AGRD1-like protein, partial [Mya arenaria]
INFIIVIAVIRKMFTSSAMMTKSDKEKAWLDIRSACVQYDTCDSQLGIRSVCVLVPIMGLTWVFGVFSVNENMVAFQYIFAICNSLQLKDGLKQRSKRKKSLATFEQSYNKQSNQHSTGEPTVSKVLTIISIVEGFTGIGDSKSTSNSNELEKATTNPFLEADRQMKELTKTKKGGTANLCDNNVITNNKLDKGAPGARAVDLDDVKISNILRESEVMSGTAGISSILPKPERRQPEQTGSRTPEEENAARKSQASHNYDHIRQSQASSHRYESIDLGKDKNVLQTPGSGEYLILQPSSQLSASSRESGSNASKEKKGEQVREKEREKERQQKIEKVRKEEEKQRKDFEKREKERREKERKERERYEREHKERERQERNKQRYVTHIGSGREDPNSATNKPHPSLSRSSRSDDDYEGQSGSGQNISSIATALPQKYDQHQGKNKKGSTSSSKKTDSLPKKEKGGKKPKGGQLRDHSRAYEYSYDTTYLGGSSRHASLENMNMQHQYGYSQYGHMPGMSGYQTGRPTHQQQHWDQYHYPQDQYGRSQYW